MNTKTEFNREIKIDGNKISLTTTGLDFDYDRYINWLYDPAIFRRVEMEFLPKEYWINEKKKTVVLKWADDSITKVKVSKDDKFDARYGFLIAYFQKHCGLSKTQANKYLDNLQKDIEKDKKEK